MINYSIIIPHKNIPDLLQRCLDSIPIHDDLETIIVDDNSDPSIVDFENFPGAHRSNTKIIYTKEGKGAGYARNIGLQYAEGKWILFADADDYFNPQIESFLNNYKSNSADCIFFDATNATNAKRRNRTKHLNYYINLAIKNPARSEFLLRFAFGEPWCKMVKHDLLIKNHILFEETPIHNDTQFSYLVGYYAKKICIEQQKLYTISYSEKSLSQKFNDTVVKTRVSVFSKKNLFLKENNISFFDDYLIDPFWHCYVRKKLILFVKCFLLLKDKAFIFIIIRKMIHLRHLIKTKSTIPSHPI